MGRDIPSHISLTLQMVMFSVDTCFLRL